MRKRDSPFFSLGTAPADWLAVARVYAWKSVLRSNLGSQQTLMPKVR